MSNPFNGTAPPVNDRQNLFGRKEIFNKLDEMIMQGKNIVLMGVEGAGKTSVLESYFSSDYRMKMALECHKLFDYSSFPERSSSSEVYAHFTDRAIDSARILKRCGLALEFKEIYDEVEQIRQQEISSESVFKSVINMLNECGYKLTLVIDNFELFTLSQAVTNAQHGVLRSLWQESKISFVVATNYDFGEDATTKQVVGSLFLQTFAGNEITIGGLSQSDIKQYIQSVLKGSAIQFDDAVIRFLQLGSGGIPKLIREFASVLYADEEKGGQKDSDSISSEVYQSGKRLMKKWCRRLNKRQVYELEYLARRDTRYPEIGIQTQKTIRSSLASRGLLCENNGLFEYNSRLLKQFCAEQGNLVPEKELPTTVNQYEALLKEFAQKYELNATEALAQIPAVRAKTDAEREDEYIQLSSGVLGIVGPESKIQPSEYRALKLADRELSLFSFRVRELIDAGIRISRLVRLLDDGPAADVPAGYAVFVFPFLQAFEGHVRENFVPWIWRADHSDLRKMFNTPANLDLTEQSITLYNIETYINSIIVNGPENAAPIHNIKWWREYTANMHALRILRNKFIHLPEELGKPPVFVTRNDAKEFIKLAFEEGVMVQTDVGSELQALYGRV